MSFFNIETLYLPSASWQYYGLVTIMAVLIAFISIYFVQLRKVVDHAFHHYLPTPLARHLLGATLTGLVAIIAVVLAKHSGDPLALNPFTLVLGTGGETIEMALAGKITLAIAAIALLGKILTTSITIGSGGSAGLLIPALYLGTMCATVLADAVHYEPMLLIAPAMTASLASIANVPLAAILIPVELFSAHYLPASLLALIVCTFLTQGNKIYRTQRETFDKRQILPGVEVRRITVPSEWNEKTLVDLDLRRKYNVTVIGKLEAGSGDSLPQIRLHPSPHSIVYMNETIVAMGAPEDLDRLENTIWAEQ